MRSIPPSGDQIEIGHGDQRAVIVEVGGGLREYARGGRDLLDGYPVDRMSSAGRGQVLIPWPNRIEDGSYEFDGRRHQLALDDPAEQDAIHGLVRWVAWNVAERDSNRVVMEHLLRPQPGYPFPLEVRIEYLLSDEGLRVRTTATNVGPDRCPYGAGAHPYLTLGTHSVDPLVLSVPGRTVLESDERGIPVRAGPVAGTEFDFVEPRPVGPTRLDHCFTDLDRDDDGRARVELRDPGSDTCLALWVDETYRLPDDLHRRPGSGRQPPQPRRRADDLSAQRVPVGRGAGDLGAGGVLHQHLGHRRLVATANTLVPCQERNGFAAT